MTEKNYYSGVINTNWSTLSTELTSTARSLPQAGAISHQTVVHHAREETKMPYRITKEGNVSHTALPALERIKRVTLILAVITAIVLILTL
jgi:hypothetical protein